MNKIKVIVIGGPTASGKSRLAIDLAKEINGEIINADSMQVYGDTPVLSAIPSKEEQDGIVHHLFSIYESDIRGNVVDWLEECCKKIRLIAKKGKIPIVVGGSGMYLQQLVEGTTPIPPVPEQIRAKIAKELKDSSLVQMYQKLQEVDAESARKISRNDKTRIIRALEIFEGTGKKASDWYKIPMKKMLPEGDFLVIKLLPQLSELEKNCAARFEKMMQNGALQEVQNLLKKNVAQDMPAAKALGVPELTDYLLHKISLEEAVKLAVLHTRQYAKRQLTWFRNKMNAHISLGCCYRGEKNVVDEVKKAL